MYALIKSGVVQNVIEADASFAALIAPEWDEVVAVSIGDAGIGWSYSNGVFTEPPKPEANQ